MAPDPHTDSFPSLKRAYLPIAAIKKKNKQTTNQITKTRKMMKTKNKEKHSKLGYGFYLKFSEHKSRYFFTTYLFKMTSF